MGLTTHVASRRRTYFHLQMAAQRLKTIADERCLAAAGVTAAQAGVMFVIAQAPGTTQRAVAATLRQRESAITGMVGRLTAAGLVDRQPSATDRRAWELSLTDKGRHALATIQDGLAELNALIDSALGDDAVDAFVDSLEALADVERPT